MKPALKILFLLTTIILTSCTVYKEIPIEVMRVREILLPDDAKIGMLYRNFKYDADTLQKYYMKDFRPVFDKINRDINIDSLAAMNCLNAFAHSLENSGTASDFQIFPYHAVGRTTGKKVSPLSAAQIQKLSDAQNPDMIIALETCSFMYSEFTTQIAEQNSCEVTMAGIWAIYNGETGKLLKHESKVDTLFWNTFDDNNKKIKLPPRIPAIEIAAVTFAENYAKKFVDDWETVKRQIIVPPPADFATAAQYAEKNRWEEAAAIWSKYTPDRQGKLAVCARYNMALAAEINDSLPEAIKWLNGAMNLAIDRKSKEEILQINRYKTILEKRMAFIEAAAKLDE